MLKLLIKKQLTEVFRNFFYDQKKKSARSKGSVAAWILLFAFLMVGVLGGMFTSMAVSLCAPLLSAGFGWLYFTITGLLSLFLGVFASVFNSYQALYLSKDNDLLFSMPIPAGTILASRLVTVYLLGFIYSAIVIVPAVIVYFLNAPFSVAALIGCIVLVAVISVLVAVLCCALGWLVAKISLRLKNKSYITVILSLLFFGVYYFFYFKSSALIRELIANASVYGEKIRSAAYPLYLFGRIGEGSVPAMLIFAAAAGALFALTLWALSRGFIKMATSTGSAGKIKARKAGAREKSAFGTLVAREFSRFLSSPNYMLNCGLGTLLIPAAGVALLIKGKALLPLLEANFGGMPGAVSVLFGAALCLLATMNELVAPSVSLEGKNLWIVKSLPVSPWLVLRAKLLPQLLLTLLPMAVCFVCGALALPDAPIVIALACLNAAAAVVLLDLFGMFMGLKMPTLDWTNEVVPIKQNMGVTIALFAGWGWALLMGGGFLLAGKFVSAVVYLCVFLAISLCACALLWLWLKKKGSAIFVSL